MLVFSSNLTIPAPDLPWTASELVPLDVALPPRVGAWLAWLSERWSLPAASIAADMLVMATSGRYALAQLNAHHIQPLQCMVVESSGNLRLKLLKPTADLLMSAAAAEDSPLADKVSQVIREQLQGLLNPQLVGLVHPDRDGESLRADDASLTIHLPQELEGRIEALAGHHDLTKSDVIRNSLFLHVYGRLRYELWTAEGSWRPKRKSARQEAKAYLDGDIKFSRPRAHEECEESSVKWSPPRRSAFIRDHGKSGEGTRVFMPDLLKQRLQEVAVTKRLPVSEYCRRSLVTLI